jgi:hypothetical protein
MLTCGFVPWNCPCRVTARQRMAGRPLPRLVAEAPIIYIMSSRATGTAPCTCFDGPGPPDHNSPPDRLPRLAPLADAGSHQGAGAQPECKADEGAVKNSKPHGQPEGGAHQAADPQRFVHLALMLPPVFPAGGPPPQAGTGTRMEPSESRVPLTHVQGLQGS